MNAGPDAQIFAEVPKDLRDRLMKAAEDFGVSASWLEARLSECERHLVAAAEFCIECSTKPLSAGHQPWCSTLQHPTKETP